MKKFLPFLALLITLVSCKKAIDDAKEDYVKKIMTDGRWYLENFIENGADSTAAFSGYEFQFYENGSVDGIYNSTKKTGTWTGDINNYSITSNFPTGAPLNKLNATWKIKDSYVDLVIAESTSSSGTSKMRLRKK